jgi:hypothetical protein
MATYLLKTSIDSDTSRERLVKAKTQAQALKHVVGDTITCKVADADDCVRLGGAGVAIEEAKG